MLPSRYDFSTSEPVLAHQWLATDLYAWTGASQKLLFTIDTPPPTVSGELHIGHCYSYAQADVIARFERMRGKSVFYPIGFDDNGLPTERFVEKMMGIKATEMDRQTFKASCSTIIAETEERFTAVLQRLGLSIDWKLRYTTISPQTQRISQHSFIELYRAGRVYTQQAPTLWCPECQTAIAQAELEDFDPDALQRPGLNGETMQNSPGRHERCGTPVTYRQTRQWFIRILDQKERFIAAGRQIKWRPEYMRQRYEQWVENLKWDWCISRQRYLGVPIPAWTCRACGETMLATYEQLPIDPCQTQPLTSCPCGEKDFEPETDILDTWATSSCSPLINAQWLQHEQGLESRTFDLRPQAHDIIRTWAFYTIVRSLYAHGDIPWREMLISGHALSGEKSKISKSKAHNLSSPLQLLQQESADALRYWATSVRPGADTPFSPETLANGRKLLTKLWNASRFAERHLAAFTRERLDDQHGAVSLLPTDHWILAQLAKTIGIATDALQQREYAAARQEIERFFWSDFCDNYLELTKLRLYGDDQAGREAARWTLYHLLLASLKLLAPFLPFITDTIYQQLFSRLDGAPSIHITAWPQAEMYASDEQAQIAGQALLEILRYVRRYKAERALSMGAELAMLHIRAEPLLCATLKLAVLDITSATRAQKVVFHEEPLEAKLLELSIEDRVDANL